MIRKSIGVALIALGFAGGVQAQGSAMQDLGAAGPQRGISKAAVERSFGTPVSRRAAVGDPPISRWVYEGFTVYFEHDHVIHAVANRR